MSGQDPLAAIHKEIAKLTELQDKLREEVSKISKNMGDYINGESRALENEFREGVRNLKKIGPVKVNDVTIPMKIRDSNYCIVAEFDMVAIDGSNVLVGEIKRKVQVEDVRRFKKQLPKFARYGPIKTGKLCVFGMIGGVFIPDNAAKEAAKYGMFVLRLKSRKILVENSENAHPVLCRKK